MLLRQMILAPIETFVGIGMNAISRKFEWEADAFACELQEKLQGKGTTGVADMGERLGRALITIHVKNLSTVWVDWLYVAVRNTSTLQDVHGCITGSRPCIIPIRH
jgi:STE24 endopeptidase